jgi:hypothetical protein
MRIEGTLEEIIDLVHRLDKREVKKTWDRLVKNEEERPVGTTLPGVVYPLKKKPTLKPVTVGKCDICHRNAKYTHEGKVYCGFHYPLHKMAGGGPNRHKKKPESVLADSSHPNKQEIVTNFQKCDKCDRPSKVFEFGKHLCHCHRSKPWKRKKDKMTPKAKPDPGPAYEYCVGCDKAVRKKDMQVVNNDKLCPECAKKVR